MKSMFVFCIEITIMESQVYYYISYNASGLRGVSSLVVSMESPYMFCYSYEHSDIRRTQ